MKRFLLFPIILSLISIAAGTASALDAREAFKKGYGLLQEGKNPAAIENFQLATSETEFPLTDYTYYYLGQAYQANQQFWPAADSYQLVFKKYRDSRFALPSLLNLGQCYMALGKYNEAERALRFILDNAPRSALAPQALYILGTLYEKNEQYTDAARIYRNLLRQYAKSTFAQDALDRLDALSKARYIASYDVPAAVVFNLGMQNFDNANYAQAKKDFKRILNDYQQSAFYGEALLMQGRILLRENKVEPAVPFFLRAAQTDQNTRPQALYYLARSYGYQDKFEQAQIELCKVVDDYSQAPVAQEALYYIGYYDEILGLTREAREIYQRFINAYPSSELFEEALWKLASTDYAQKDYAAAYEKFCRVLEMPSRRVSDRLYFWTGKCAQKLEKMPEAASAYKLTIDYYDHSYYAYRARDLLKSAGIDVPLGNVARVAVTDLTHELSDVSPEATAHARKYEELLKLGLAGEAAAEAEFLSSQLPTEEKKKAEMARYHAYIQQGEYTLPIRFAERQLEDAMQTRSLFWLDPYIWQFAYPRGYWQYVEKYAAAYGVDPALVYAVIREESRFRSYASSRVAAAGLMQVMPSTARRLCEILGLSYSRWGIYDPEMNIQMGTYYLAKLVRSFDGNIALALAGYNGGPNRVQKWKNARPDYDMDEFIENIPLRETRNYVKKVLKSYYGYKRTYANG